MNFQHVSDLAPITVDDDADDALIAQLRKAGPMNLAWAREVMEARGVDALVLGDPLNIFHVTGHWTFVGRTRPGAPPTMFVIVTRDPDTAPALVAPRFYYYYTVVDGNFGADRPFYIWGEAGDGERPFYPSRGEAPLDAVEIHRMAQLELSLTQHSLQEGMTKTLAFAMRDLGVDKGRACYDYAAIPGWMDFEGVAPQWEQADDILRHIRMVKSPLEIAMMRRASAGNLAAIHATMSGARDGMSHREFRRRFFAEAAARGNQGVTLTINRCSNELADLKLADGDGLMIDAVSHFNTYHGDYGRTLFLGEPSKPLSRAVEAMSAGWDAIRAALKPGVMYSQITAIGAEATRKSGYDFKIAYSTHSVGLMHTDEPFDWSQGVPTKLDLPLRENMIVSVDCPVLETGFGGSAHLEDLTLITADGGVPIHPASATALIV
jgi:Xaa-Pro aminopeptidase